ncbi:hypothetical protein HY612_04380 [Candidatus Roizmanbacteria bacterium]|nr:hypothetical protein [Candidatus Roizmanbacteria bacterium]
MDEFGDLMKFDPNLTASEIEDLIIEGARPSPQDLLVMLKTAFKNTYGTEGLATFEKVTLDRLVQMYALDPKKMGLKGVDILNVLEKHRKNADKWLKEGAIPDRDLRLIKERPRMMQDIQREALALITKGRVRQRVMKKATGIPLNTSVRGIVIDGSWAFGSFDSKSDMDVLHIVHEDVPDLTREFNNQLKDKNPLHSQVEPITMRPLTLNQLHEVEGVLSPRRMIITPEPQVQQALTRLK